MEMRENRNIFFIRNRLVKNDYKFPQKTSCFITEHSLDRQILSSKTFCSTQNSFRDSINSSKEKSTKPSKVEIPSITLNNFKKLQFMINAKRKVKYSSKLLKQDKPKIKNEDLALPPHLLASHLSTLHPSPSLRLYASLRKKILPPSSPLSIPSPHSPSSPHLSTSSPPPSSLFPPLSSLHPPPLSFSPHPSSLRPSPPAPSSFLPPPSPPPFTFLHPPSSLSPPPPKGKRFSIEFSICDGIHNLLKNKVFLNVLRDFGENVTFLRETVGVSSSTRILLKISGYTDKIGFLLFCHSKPKDSNKLSFNHSNDLNLISFSSILSLEHLTERIRMSYNLITGDKVEGCFDEKFLPVLVYYNRNLEELIGRINEDMIRNGAEEYKDKVKNLENLINSKRRGEKIEVLRGTPQISVLSRIEKIEGELGRLEYIGSRTRIKARFLDRLLTSKYSS